MRQALVHTTTLLIAALCGTFVSASTRGEGRSVQVCSQPPSALLESEMAPPGCHWSGNAPFCNGECKGPRYAPVKADNCGDGHCCWTGKKVLCCLKKKRPTRPTPPKKRPHHVESSLESDDSGLKEEEDDKQGGGWDLIEKLLLGI
jgi:hypothetical protein